MLDNEDKMAKKNKNEKIVGTPSMALLPKRNYKFDVGNKEIMISIPIDDKTVSGSDIFDAENNVFYINNISNILIKLDLYPKLKSNQLFTPTIVLFKKKNVEIIGNIVTMIQ